jgi:hypothetical protein
MLWVGSFIVAGGITVVTRGELMEAGLWSPEITLRYLRLYNFAESSRVTALFVLALAAVDFAVLYALSGRSRGAEVARGLWSTAVTAAPLVGLALALIALDMPFRTSTMARSRVRNEQLEIERRLKEQLVGTWNVVRLRKASEAGAPTSGEMTVTFSQIRGSFPDLRADSSDEAILGSGKSWVNFNGFVPHLSLADGKQDCLVPREPGDRMTLWVAPSGAPLDKGPPGEVTVVTLERRPHP